jgi:hypothetical protein
VVELYLVSSDGSPLEEASWFYRMHPIESFRSLPTGKNSPVSRAGDFSQGPLEAGSFADAPYDSTSVYRVGEDIDAGPPSDLKLVLATGTFMLADVMGSAVIRGKRCYAQTALLLFGDSLGGEPLKTNAASPHWPSFLYHGSGDLYFPQTGQSFTFTVREGTILGPVRALRDEGPVPGEFVPADNGISFTPANDPELSRLPSTATKPVYMLGGLPDGGTVSFTYYVHRNRYAAQDLPMGLGLSGLAFLATGLGILGVYWAGRRAPRHAAQTV